VWTFNRQNQARTICKIIIGFFIIVWIYFIFIGGFFLNYGDDLLQVIHTTAIGEDIFILGIVNGRFWPLGLSYYNVLRLLPYGFTPQAHYMLNALIFTGFVLLLLKILNFNLEQNPMHLYITTFLVCCLSFVYISTDHPEVVPFFGVVYTETFLCFLFALFVFCYKKIMAVNEDGERSPQERTFWALLAVIIAVFATYCKEPTFIIFLIIACTNLLFAKKHLKKFDKIFNGIFIVNAISFLLVYYFIAFSRKKMVYAAKMDLGAYQFGEIMRWFDIFPIMLLFAIFVTIRVYYVLFKKDRQHIFYDSLLFGAFGYCTIIIALRVTTSGHYLFPAMVLFFIVLAYWLISFYDFKKYVLLLLISFFIFNCSLSGFTNATDFFIKQHSLVWKRPELYNILKLDILSKHNKIIYVGDNNLVDNPLDFAWLALLSLNFTLQYFNSGYFSAKALDDTESAMAVKPYIIGEAIQNETIDPKVIYVDLSESLALSNKKFSDFVSVAKLNLFGETRYVYVHRDRI
jgi:hypothetical protein